MDPIATTTPTAKSTRPSPEQRQATQDRLFDDMATRRKSMGRPLPLSTAQLAQFTRYDVSQTSWEAELGDRLKADHPELDKFFTSYATKPNCSCKTDIAIGLGAAGEPLERTQALIDEVFGAEQYTITGVASREERKANRPNVAAQPSGAPSIEGLTKPDAAWLVEVIEPNANSYVHAVSTRPAGRGKPYQVITDYSVMVDGVPQKRWLILFS